MIIWRFIASFLLAACACLPANAQQTKAQMNTYNNAVIIPNGVGAITAANLHPLLGNMINASCTIADALNCPITALGGATANLPLIGAPSGGGVTQGARSGNTTLFPTVDSAPVSGNCAVFDSAGGLINTPCTAAGSGTVGAGTVGNLAVYTGSTAVAGAGLFYANVACNGSTDVSAAINSALTAASGGTLILPAGACIVTANVVAVPPHTTLTGQGPHSTILQTASATGDVMTVDGGSRVTNLGITSSITRTLNAFIDVNDSTVINQKVSLDHLWMSKHYVGILINTNAGACSGCISADIDATVLENGTAFSAGGGGSSSISMNSPGDMTITNTNSINTTGNPANDIFTNLAINQGSVTLVGSDFLGGEHGATIAPAAGQSAFLRATGSYFDTTSLESVLIVAQGANAFASFFAGNMWFGPNCASCNGGVVTNTATGGQIQAFSITGSQFHDYSVTHGVAVSLNGNINQANIEDNQLGVPGAQFHDGVVVGPNINNFSILGNTTGSCVGFQVIVASGTSNNYLVTNNKQNGCGNSGVSDGGTGVSKLVNNNL